MPDWGSARQPDGPAVIVDPYSSGALLAPAFARRGIRPIAVLTAARPPDVYASSYRPPDFAEVLVYDGDIDDLTRRVAALGPRCVLAGCESGVELTEVLAPAVVPDVANVAALAGARRHKGEMAAAVARAGYRTIPQICATEADQVARWIDEAGLAGRDLVIKPPKSASTDGVTFVAGGRGWREMFEGAIGGTNRLGLVNDALVVQQHVEGTEYVVDTFSHDGVHTVADVCQYSKLRNGPYMAVYDALEWMDPNAPVVADLVAYTSGVLDSVGMRFGAAHVEVMDTEDGPVLIELGARAHGGGQPKFCLLATNDSQIERTARYFDGERDIPVSYQLAQQMLAVFHLAHAAGRVADTDGLERIRQLATYCDSTHNFAVGDDIEMTKDAFGSLALGFVVLSGHDRDQIWRDYARIRAIEAEMFVPRCSSSAHRGRTWPP